MPSASDNRADITGVTQIVGKMTFQMDRFAAQKSFANKSAHLQHFECELQVVACRQFQMELFGMLDQGLCFLRRDREWLLKIDMATRSKALFANRKMALGRSRNMDHVRRCG